MAVIVGPATQPVSDPFALTTSGRSSIDSGRWLRTGGDCVPFGGSRTGWDAACWRASSPCLPRRSTTKATWSCGRPRNMI